MKGMQRASLESFDSMRPLAVGLGPARELRAYVTLMLDAGLRSGEALGLRWRCVRWADGADDQRRALVIEESKPRGGPPGPTKSGRSRIVALSWRLQEALFDLYKERRPKPDDHVIYSPDHTLYDTWRRLVKRAGIGPVARKDLRDTFASQLLTCGVQLGYISKQLGHANVKVTADHYAKWCGGDEYREPLRLEEGELPPDLLARLPKSPQSPPRSLVADDTTDDRQRAKSAEVKGETWCPGLDSNQHPHYTDQALNLACLPIPPPGHSVGSQS